MDISKLRFRFFRSEELVTSENPLYWRQYVFSIFITIFIASGLYLSIDGAIQFYHEDNVLMALFDIFIYLTMVVVCTNKRIPYSIRESVVIYILLITGIVLLITTGPYGASTTFIFTSFVSSGLFHTKRKLIVHSIISILSYLVLSALMMKGAFVGLPIMILKDTWLVVVSNNLVIGIALSLLVYIVTQGLAKQTVRTQEKQEYLKKVFSSVQDGLITINQQGKVLLFNQYALELFPKDELAIGKELQTIFKFPNNLQTEEFLNHLEFTMNTEAAVLSMFSAPIELSDGLYHPVSFTLSTIQSKTAHTKSEANSGLLIAIHDLTEKQQHEEDLERFAWIIDQDSGELLDDKELYIQTFDQEMLQGPNHVIASYIRTKMMKALSMEIALLLDGSVAVYEQSGEMSFFLTSSSWEKALFTSDISDRLILNRWENAGRIALEQNKVYETVCMSGLHLYAVPVEVYGQAVGTVVLAYGPPPESKDRIEQISDDLAIDFKVLSLASLAHKLRPPFIINTERSRFRNIAEYFGEIIERAFAEQNLAHTENIKRIGALTGGIAHDFNNILTGLYGYISLAQSLDSVEEIQQYLIEAENSLDRAKALTQRLLSFSKGENPLFDQFDVVSSIQEILNFEMSGSAIKQELIHDKELYTLRADKTQFEQVISNVVHNGMQAMPDKGKLSVELQNIVEASIPYVKISITDTGIGITEEALSHIFDLYYTSKDDGNGLGLATVKAIINRHGGRIEVHSQVGVGTCFTIWFLTDPER